MTTVAILGGGFAGAAVAYHLARGDGGGRAEIVVIEPRETLGAGLAYSSPDPAHRINVPAERMSLDTEDPQAFARWLAATGAPDGDEEAIARAGQSFPQRALFGRYVAATLAPLLTEGRIVHRRTRAEAVRRDGEGPFAVDLGDGCLVAEILVIATTHPPPAIPRELLPVSADPRFIADPYGDGALQGIGAEARVLVVGNGLTAADAVATLDRRGHRGPVLMLSRHGLRSRGHAAGPIEPFGDFVATPSRTALSLLRRTRGTIAEAARRGLPWHAVLDALRSQGSAIWQGLPEPERRQIVRRLRSFWDVHRFRIAPQVADVLERRETAGTLASIAASLVTSRRAGEDLVVAYRRRGRREVETGRFDAIVNTTGPAHRGIVDREPVRALHQAGLVGLDGVGLGLSVGLDHRALDREGRPVPRLFVAGPLARGTFGELMGLPQVTMDAQAVADAIRLCLERETRAVP